MTTHSTLADTLAAFVHGLNPGTIPPDVQEKARTCLLNGYGMALGGHATPFAPVARTAAMAMDGERPGGATLWGDGRRTSVAGATLANAALAHGRAQEDACGAAHFGAILIPLLTALFEARALPMDRFLPALIAGYEVGGLFEQAFSGQTTPAGLRASPLYGIPAAAAAAARAMALPPDRIAAALACGAHFAGGILQSFADGSDEWRYQVGQAGVNGLIAAELAAAGAQTAPRAFEGDAGFIRAFTRTIPDVGALRRRIGEDWSLRRVAFKPFPVCAFNQTPVTAALALHAEIAGRPIGHVVVHMNPYVIGYAGMASTGPFRSLSATLMSIPFCVALALQHGRCTLAMMGAFDDAAVLRLVGAVTLTPDPAIPVLSAVIEAVLQDGTTLVRDQAMTSDDYAYDRGTVATLVRRIGVEEGVPGAAYDGLEQFVDDLPGSRIEQAIAAFGMLPPACLTGDRPAP